MAELARDRAWLEMRDVVKRRLGNSVWLPLYQSYKTTAGQHSHLGFWDDYFGVRTLAVHVDRRQAVEEYSFSDLANTAGGPGWDGEYTPFGSHRDDDGEIGVDLTLWQNFDGPQNSILHLSEDLIFALRLVREGDKWLRPEEGYVEVARLEHDPDGRAKTLLIRPEFLCDYLSARKMALLTLTYRERILVVLDPSTHRFSREEDHSVVQAEIEGGRLELRAAAIHEGGLGFGAKTAVFTMARTDSWEEGDLPILGPPTDENVISESATRISSSRKLFRLSGEFRRNEWIEPANASPRVGRDEVPSQVSFIVDASGGRMLSHELDNEDIGRWLWFSPAVIPAVLAHRGASLEWYTRDTAGVFSPSGLRSHIGLNEVDLIVVYAHDIARLDEWERRIWAGFNVIPQGGLGTELQAAQVHTAPANTEAPEAWIGRSRTAVDAAFARRWGTHLFTNHEHVSAVIANCDRFRATNEAGFLALAKDLARITADSIDIAPLHKISPPLAGGQGRGSLASMQRVLTTIVGPEESRRLMSPFVGVYDLRLGDAHLPSATLAEAMALAEIDENQSWLRKGQQLLHCVVSALFAIEAVVGASGVP